MKRSALKRIKSLAPVSAQRRNPVKPKDRGNVAVMVYADGREKCLMHTGGGKAAYNWRIRQMAERQEQVCCLYGHIEGCPGTLLGYGATFEHEDGRGMGGAKRDDRIEKDGMPYNGAAHWQCNQDKGSRYIDYNNRKSSKRGPQ